MKTVAIVGSGPAALMMANVVASGGRAVTLVEKRKSAGRKLLVAGSSGLNVTHRLPHEEFISHYTGRRALWDRVLRAFSPSDWLRFIDNLGIGTFEGTSGRYFVEDMKASKLLQAWVKKLQGAGVEFRFGLECTGFVSKDGTIELCFSDGSVRVFDAVGFALGGGSWEPAEVPLRWPAMFREHGIGFEDFRASNVGYQIAWSEAFLREAEGMPLKNIVIGTRKGERKGDAMVTRYGMEGTPVYFVGQTGEVWIDLKPDLDSAAIVRKLRLARENLSPMRRVKKLLGLCPASEALLFHTLKDHPRLSPLLKEGERLQELAAVIKALPLRFGDPQPLSEAISSSGGVRFDELDDEFMLLKMPGAFASGEMLDWDVPTGGFLIQGCVSQGFCAGQGILRYLR